MFERKRLTIPHTLLPLLLGLVLVPIITFAISYDVFLEQSRLYILLNILLFYSSYIIFTEYQKKELFSPLSLFATSVTAHFALSGLFYPDEYIFANSENYRYIVYAAAYIIGFLFIFHYTYHLLPTTSIKSCFYRHNAWNTSRVIKVGILLLLIGWAARGLIIHWNVYLQTSLGTEEGARRISFLGSVRQLEILPNYAGYIFLIHYLSCKESGKVKIAQTLRSIATFILLLNIVYWLPTGKKLPIISSVAIPLIIFYFYTKRLPAKRYTVSFILFVILIFPATHMYRVTQVQIIGGNNVDSFSSMINIIEEAIRLAPEAESIGARGRTFGRLNQLEPIAGSIRVIETDQIDLRMGQDYLNSFVNMVPGALWPDKPLVMYGNEFGHWIGMLRMSDPFTSISVTLIGESYLNFSIAGIFIGAFLSFIYWISYRTGRFGLSRDTTILIYCGAVPIILYIGASFALYISSLVQTCLMLYFVSLPLRKKNRHIHMIRSISPSQHQVSKAI